MRRKPKRASTPIDTEQDSEISESQKRHYAQLGYKPYISHTGKIKWLSDDQHVYEQIKYAPQNKIKLPTLKIRKKPSFSRTTRLWIKILLDNWLFILILLGILFLLIKIDFIINILMNF